MIRECINGERSAQKQLYDLFAPKMFAVCLRYAGNAEDAEDLLQEGAVKVFRNLASYRGEGSFEGWIRRIFIYTCIEQLRRKKAPETGDVENIPIEDKELSGYDKLAMEDLMNIIRELPDGYRAVVNLYLVEGYGHKEIATMLGISEGTSKSQLARARAILQKRIEKMKIGQ